MEERGARGKLGEDPGLLFEERRLAGVHLHGGEVPARERAVEILMPRLGPRELPVERGDVRVRVRGGDLRQPFASPRLDDRRDDEAVEKVLGASAAAFLAETAHVRIPAIGREREPAAENELRHLLEMLELFDRERRARGDDVGPVGVVRHEPHGGPGSLPFTGGMVREERVEVAEHGGQPLGGAFRQKAQRRLPSMRFGGARREVIARPRSRRLRIMRRNQLDHPASRVFRPPAWLALLVPAATAGFLAAASMPDRPFDLLIRHARVVDGTGGAWYRGDVGVRDGRIAAIGKLDGARAARVIDADDRVLAPGFIDVHTHVEGNLPARPDAENLVADGVTTVVTGNCGGSELAVGDWLESLEKSGIAINVATLVGHNSVRAKVMGYADRAPTARELGEMEALVDRAMREGAVGFSTGLIYTPGTFARPDEVVALARVAARAGGIYATHMRSENDGLFPAIDEALDVARRAGIPLEISHYKVTAKKLWGASERMIAKVDAARREGLDVTLDEYPYTASSSGLDVLLPDRALQAPGSLRHALVRRLMDPKERAGIARDMRRRLHDELGRDHLDYSVVASAPWRTEVEGKNLRELNREAGRPDVLASEIETALDLCRDGAASGRGGGVCGTQMVYHTMDENDVERIFADPLTMVARDGGVAAPGSGAPHPRSYGTCARVLSRFVRERGLVSLEEAVRKMTSLPAARFSFADRGMVKEGFRADLVLFDPDEVEDLSRFEDPHHFSRGFDVVVVNGTIVRENGSATCERPGMALRGAGVVRSVRPVSAATHGSSPLSWFPGDPARR